MQQLHELTITAHCDLSLLSGGNAAYIKRVVKDSGIGYAVYLGDGTELAVFPNRDAAYYTARQHDLEPYSVH